MANPQAQEGFSFVTNGIIHPIGDQVHSFALSSNGEDLAMVCYRKIIISNMSNHDENKVIRMDDFPRSISYSPDGELFVIADEYKNLLHFYKTTNYEKKQDSMTLKNMCTISFSRDAAWLFVGGNHFLSILRKDKNTGDYEECRTETEKYGLSGKSVSASSFASSNDDIVAFSVETTVFWYNIKTDTVLHEHRQSDSVCSIQFSPCDQFLAIGGRRNAKGYFQVYHVSSSSVLCEHQHDNAVTSICYSTTSKIIIVGDSTYMYFYDINAATKHIVYKHIDNCFSINPSNPSKIAIAGFLKVKIYDTNIFKKSIVHEKSEQANIKAVTWSPNGHELAYGTEDKTLKVMKSDSNIPTIDEINFEASITAIAYSIDGNMLACGTDEGDVYVLKKDTENPTQPYDKKNLENRNKLNRTSEIRVIKFSRDGKFLAILEKETTIFDNELILYSLPNFEELKKFNLIDVISDIPDISNISSIDFCTKENQIAMGGDGIYNLIDDDDKRFAKLELDHTEMENVAALEYSQDEMLIACGHRNRKITIRRADNNELVASIESLGPVFSLSFSPDSKVLAVGSTDGIVQLFHGWQHQVCNPIYLPSKECSVRVMFYPDTQLNENAIENNNIAPFYYLTLIQGKTIRTIRVHQLTTSQPNHLLKRYTDQELMEVIKNKKSSFPLYTRDDNGNMLFEYAGREERFGLKTEMIKYDGSIAFLAEDSNDGYWENHNEKIDQYKGRILKKMADKYLLDDLTNSINSLLVTTSSNIFQDFYYLLQDMAKKELPQMVTKLLNAKIAGVEKYKGCPEGFFIADTLYARTVVKDGQFLRLRSMRINPEIKYRPVTKKQVPRSSSDFFYLRKTCWKDMEDDPDELVKLYLLVVYLPDLGSFESLKTLTNMQSTKAFNSIALHAVLDALWNNFAGFWFYLQFGIYSVFLLSFTAFCEITKYRKQALVNTEDPWWILWLLSALIFVGLAFFAYVEVRQIQKLNHDYFKKSWNYVQCISIVLVATTMILRLKQLLATESTGERSIAFVSAGALFSLWFGFLSHLRGIESFAWIIKALLYIFGSLKYFIVVVVLVIVSFTVVLRALHDGGPADLRKDGNFTSEDNQYHNINAPYGNLVMSFLTTIMAGMFATFELEDLEDSYLYLLSLVLMLFMLLFVMIVALNALIAFISERFEVILNERTAALMLEKAEIIVDIYCLFTDKYRAEIEARNRWTSVVVPAASLNELNPLENLSRATKDDSNQIQKKVNQVENDSKEIKNDVKELKALKDDSKEMKSELRVLKDDLEEMKTDSKQMQGDMKKMMDNLEVIKKMLMGKQDNEEK